MAGLLINSPDRAENYLAGARITKYSEPVPFHKTMGTRKVVLMKRVDDDDTSSEVPTKSNTLRGNTNKGTVSMMDFEKIIRDHEIASFGFRQEAGRGRADGFGKT